MKRYVVAFLALGSCGGSLAGTPSDGGTAFDTSTGADGSSGGSSSSGGSDSGGLPVDAGARDSGEAATDAAVIGDATETDGVSIHGNPPTYPSIECPAEDGAPSTCQPGQFCCVVGNAMQGVQTDTCEPGDASCAGTPVHCAVPGDCLDGQVCCGTEQTEGTVTSYVDVSCSTECAGANQRVFCNPATNTCPASAPTCAISEILPGYNVCNQ